MCHYLIFDAHYFSFSFCTIPTPVPPARLPGGQVSFGLQLSKGICSGTIFVIYFDSKLNLMVIKLHSKI